MNLRNYLSFARREARGSQGRFLFFAGCLALGVAAVVAVAGTAASLEQGIRREARQLIAADLVVRGTRPIPPAVADVLSGLPGVSRADVKEFASVAVVEPAGGESARSQIVELKAVVGEYPFYGTLRLDPVRPLAELLRDGGIVVGPELLGRLRVRVGDRVKIGQAEFVIRGTVLAEPDRVNVVFTLGPRVLMSMDGLARSGLEAFGSRITYRALIKAPPTSDAAAIDRLAKRLTAALPRVGPHQVESYLDAQPALREGLRRATRFLGLVALLSLLIGGVGVAQTVRAWLASRMDSIAVLKCLGMRPREILALYLGQTLLLGLAGSFLGALVGSSALLAAPRLLKDLWPAGGVLLWPWAAVARGVILGVGVSLIFGLPPLAAVRRIAPLRVLRRNVEPVPPSLLAQALSLSVLMAGVFLTSWAQSESAARAAVFSAGLIVVVSVLAAAAAGVMRAVGRWPRGIARVWMRHGLTAIARPGAGTVGATLALGIGVLVVLTMHLVGSRLAGQLRAELPTAAPTAFLVGIQPEQWSGVRGILEQAGATRIEVVPIVTARLTKVDGRPVAQMTEDSRGGRRGRGEHDRRWMLTREQNLTYLEDLPAGNVVTEGALWRDPGRQEISIEQDFARDLGVKLGSVLDFDVQGVPIHLTVTSLRRVDWRTFGINFFLIVEPGVLDHAPQARVAAMRLPPGSEQAVQDRLAASFPNLVLLRIREVLDKVAAILDRVAVGVRAVGSMTVLGGILILAGAVGAGSVRRGREVALLKTLGMTRAGVAAVFSVEYALLGLVAGSIGACAAELLAWAVLAQWWEIEWSFQPVALAGAILGTAALAVLAGLGASAGAMSRRPVEVLRDE